MSGPHRRQCVILGLDVYLILFVFVALPGDSAFSLKPVHAHPHTHTTHTDIYTQPCFIKDHVLERQERWRRNRTGRPLSPSQIHQKNILTLSKFHKTTSECWQRTSVTQQSGSLASKTGRNNYKRWKKRQRRWGGSSVPGRESRPGKRLLKSEVSKHKETFSQRSLWRALEAQRAT